MNNISIIQKSCMGCRSCEQICPQHCITIEDDEEGFGYPVVDEERCIHCGICTKSCPAEHTEHHRNKPLCTWALKNKNEKDIMRSASGGAADLAARVILQQGGIVYGAAYDEKLSVRHIEINRNEDREKLQSSKYVQSDINDCYSKAKKHILEDNSLVLFTGTPCQIAGLYTFLGQDYPNLYTLDLICHGVPSPKLFRRYLEYQSRVLKGQVVYYNFRSKEKRGWGTQYLLKMKTKTKEKMKLLVFDRYGKHFMEGDCYRESCYICPYANIDRVGDITVGDFWGIAQSHPDFYSYKGVSSVFVNTRKGAVLFRKIEKLADVKEITLAEGLVKQGNLVRPSGRPISRDSFYRNINEPYFIKNLHVGLQLKERVKAVLPNAVIRKLKTWL